jgi:hypothetical protein
MGEPLTATSSTSSDYFEPEDPAFNEALQMAVLPGDAEDVRHGPADREDYADPPQTERTLKRSHSMVEDSDESLSYHHLIPLEERQDLSDEDPETYGASSFGGFGQYMRRKRAKLQIQNAQMDDTNDNLPEKSRIFQGIAIYVRVCTLGVLSCRVPAEAHIYAFDRLMGGRNPQFRTCVSSSYNTVAFSMRIWTGKQLCTFLEYLASHLPVH